MADNICKAIQHIRNEGHVDLLNRALVSDRCKKLGYEDAANWVAQNPKAYSKFLIDNMIVCTMSWVTPKEPVSKEVQDSSCRGLRGGP